MDWSNERYVRVYLRDTLNWLALGWEAQALFLFILRKVDRAGVLELGKGGIRGLAAFLRMPLEVVEKALPLLLEDGCLEMTGTALVVPHFIEAQESRMSPAMRQMESRIRRRDDVRAGLDPDHRETVIYFIQSEHGGSIKIGRADDLARRMVGLQTTRPDKLVLLAAAPGTVQQEGELHKRFAAAREKGEWFLPVPELMELIADVATRGSVAFDVTKRDRSRNVTGHETHDVTPSRTEPCRAVLLKEAAGAARTAEPQEDLPPETVLPAPTIEPEAEPSSASESPPPAHDVGPGQANGARRGRSPSARQARQKGSQGPPEAPPGHPRRQLSDALMAVYFDVCGCKYPFSSRDAAKLEDILRLADGDIGEAAARFRWALSDAPPWQGGPPREGATKFIYRLPAVWAALAGAPRPRTAATGPPWLATPAGAAWKAGLERVREAGASTYLLESIQPQVAECRIDGEEVVIKVDRFGANALEDMLPAKSLEAFGGLRWEVGEGC